MLNMRRGGYSLFEVVVVMGVVVVVGFLTLPLIRPLLQSNHLQAASDLVQARWTEMRYHAIAEGRAYRFAVMANTGLFRIAPDDGRFWGDSANISNSDAPPWIVEDTLPGEVLFKSAANGGSGGSGGWTNALTFLPDGTSREDVKVAFGLAGSRALTLKLRGATGSVTAGEEGNGS